MTADRAITLGSRTLEDEYLSIIRDMGGDVAGRVGGDERLLTTHALYHGGPTPWALTPKIFDRATVGLMRDAAETMGAIMDKVTRAFVEDASFRALFELDPRLEELCCLPCGYERQIPLARVDIFLDEETGAYQFCELNTDGSAGMVTTDEVTRTVRQTASFQEFERRHPGVETFDTCGAWLDALLATYASWKGPGNEPDAPAHADEAPEVAIVDFQESIDLEDVAHFSELLAERGVRARFCDVRDLRIVEVDGRARLADVEGPIDLVWRRAVSSELMEKWCDGAEALARALRENLACVVGGLRTWPCATKTVFAVLWGDAAKAILTPEELEFVHEHVPYTETLSADSDLSRFGAKDEWIVKPAGGYNAVGVLAGLDAGQDEWEQALELAAQGGGVVQRYAPQYQTPLLRGGAPVEGEDPLDARPASNMEGLYLFDGKFAGVFTRSGFANTIGEWTSRFNLGCFVVGEA